mmetsp:Transcript_27057/g.26117  ORF Transcript_27057/g.26117 Transcript_27057/m.26117 type:complete len:258 (+) Transcript_27057:34-807(+)
MAVGKNKRLLKKKGSKKKPVDPMSKKDWYDVKAPSYFKERQVCKTCVSRTAGTKIAADGLRGRVFEASLADLNQDENSYRKIRLMCEEVVSGNRVLTNFHGLDFTTDKLRSLVKKWQTLIEAWTDVKTTDGYVLRLFCIGFTCKRPTQISKTSYAQSAQCKRIRAKMVEIMQRECATCDLKGFVEKLLPESITKDIEKACHGIYPLHNVHIRKVKVVRKPKFDVHKLMELHGEVGGVDGSKVKRDAEFAEPAVLDEV